MPAGPPRRGDPAPEKAEKSPPRLGSAADVGRSEPIAGIGKKFCIKKCYSVMLYDNRVSRWHRQGRGPAAWRDGNG